MSLYAILAALGSIAAAIIGAFAMGARSSKHKRDAQAARRKADTFRKATEAQNAVDDLSDDAVTDRLRKRASR